MRAFNIILIVLAARAAAAEPIGEDWREPPASAPDQSSGLTVDDDNCSPLGDVRRAVLYPVRLGTEVTVTPLLGGAWLVERYQLRDAVAHFFVLDDGSYRLYPTALVETGAGINARRYLFRGDLFGHREHLALADDVRDIKSAGPTLLPACLHLARDPQAHTPRVIGLRR